MASVSTQLCLLLLALFAITAFAWGPNRLDMDDEDDMMNEDMDMGADMEGRADSTEWVHFRADAPNGTQRGASSPAPCSPAGKCFAHSDCGANGRCIGVAVGTCDCTACGQGLLCNAGALIGQASCGGLRNACNATTNLCDCNAGYVRAGFKNMGDAILKFCNKEKCDGQTDTCNGLPCHSGICVC